MYRLCICRSHRVYTEYSTSIIITTQDGNRYAKQKSQLSQKGRALCLTSSAVFYYLFIYLFENRRQRTGIGHYHAMKMK